ncbi:MAG: endolytic transglycosylase MltG [Chlorobiaceae bacterium]|nr:endolytic transglycosylase MltG [Chlorobiaceae bacterium]
MPRRPKLFRSALVKTTLALLVLAVSLLMLAPGVNTLPPKDGRAAITVHRGEGFRQIVEELHEAGVIRFRWPLLAAGALIPPLHKIKPGRYIVSGNFSTVSLLWHLHSHPQDEVRLMIPNGVEQTRIAGIVADGLDIDSTAFMAATRDPRLLRSLGIEAPSTEGYLFPGTYNFAWASTPDEVVAFLAGRFRAFYSDSLKQAAARAGFDENRLLTLASIVEAETPLDEEKPLIASVYLNRLKIGMRLQADPTVQYAIDGEARRLSYKDLETDSPYNTYRHPGLPPGPICNPGEASIRAVLNPAKTDYLYFVANGRGGHAFASSLSGHARNVRHYRSVRAQQEQQQATENAEP